ncbi:Fc.00g028670.m01.CDS01 [Cosmosporella sp. VM-42]
MQLNLLLAAFVASSNAASITLRGGERLYTIELGPDDVRTVTEDEKWALKAQHKNFIDITDLGEAPVAKIQARASFPDAIAETAAVQALFPKLNQNRTRDNLVTFSNFHNRYYNSTYGQDSAAWLLGQVNSIVSGSGARGVNVTTFVHAFKQPSIIAKIPGQSDKTIVVGAHQDSINVFDRMAGRAPGADDNGSGAMGTLEAFRTILTDSRIASNQAANSIEFHWYAGEEAGLLGSGAIFQQYSQDGKDVKAMLCQDMTGYVKPDTTEIMGIITDNADPSLTAFLKKVIAAYSKLPTVDSECGYACSDHASATKFGYPSAFAVESTFEDSYPSIHTPSDVIDYVNFDHVMEFVKVVIGFAYELGFAEL